jgi:predicted DNA-binding protein with PD1-like motif
METFAIRLLPGQDIRPELDALAQRHQWAAACILSGVGSLSRALIRFANKPHPAMLDGPLEMISMSGTLSASGGSHLHAAVADAEGRVWGGHVGVGCRIFTTAEIVIGVLPGLQFHRTHDPSTGQRELDIRSGA